MIKRLWIWFVALFHNCESFRWDMGYGLTKLGLGRYEYKVCRDCGKPTGHTFNL
jgi:hypothetical protein